MQGPPNIDFFDRQGYGRPQVLTQVRPQGHAAGADDGASVRSIRSQGHTAGAGDQPDRPHDRAARPDDRLSVRSQGRIEQDIDQGSVRSLGRAVGAGDQDRVRIMNRAAGADGRNRAMPSDRVQRDRPDRSWEDDRYSEASYRTISEASFDSARSQRMRPQWHRNDERPRLGRRPHGIEFPTFDGTGGLDDFVAEYNILATAERMTGEEKASRLIGSLKGEVKKWYLAQYETFGDLTWDEIILEMQQIYGQASSYEASWTALQNCRQKQDELCTQYVQRKVTMCKRTEPDMSSGKMVAMVKVGFKPHMVRALAPFSPRTVQELLGICRRIEETDQMLGLLFKKNKDKAREGQKGQVSSAPAPARADGKAPEQRPYQPRDMSTVECRECHKMGHYARFCPNRQGVPVAQTNTSSVAPGN